MLYTMWILAGWCGTPFPRWWWWPGPPPPPDPEPWLKPQPVPWLAIKLASIAGGVIGGWMTQQILGGEVTVIGVLTSFAGATIGGGFVGGVAGLVTSRRSVPAPANVQARA